MTRSLFVKTDRGRGIVYAALIVFLLPSRAAAVCIEQGPPWQSYWRYSAVFEGTVASIERLDRKEQLPGRREVAGDRFVTFHVNRSWKGVEGDRAHLVLDGGFGIGRP